MARYDETSGDRDSYELDAGASRRSHRVREPREDHVDREETNSGGATVRFLLGVGIGLGIALLFAPQSGEETRRWLMETANDRYRQLRRQSRRLVFETQDLLDRGEQRVTRALRSGKHTLESVAAKLDEHTKG
jgi:gas vesicle protein